MFLQLAYTIHLFIICVICVGAALPVDTQSAAVIKTNNPVHSRGSSLTGAMQSQSKGNVLIYV